MLTLSLETALQGFGVALHGEGILLVHRFNPESRQASGALLPMLEALLEEAETPPSALQKIVVNRGPGSFTGIRLGMATAQALSLGLGIPWESVTSFEIAAYAFICELQHMFTPVLPVWLLVDTKGFQMGCAAFSLEEKAIFEPFYGTPQDIAETCLCGKNGIILGTGLERLKDHLPNLDAFFFHELSGASLACFAGAYAQISDRFTLHGASQGEAPLYGLHPYAL
ncbi:MAG: tRNA (adenosine(37)-N6)-threonylcarbamoyltransferase complex dimerization subunit type 1 TsaB [Alphaproteobacteria bacterium]